VSDTTNPTEGSTPSASPVPPAAPVPPYAAPSYGSGSYGTPPPAYGTQPPTPGYAAPSYAPQGYAPGYAPARTNVMAIISLVASIAGLTIVPLIGSIVGTILGHMALKQVRTSGEAGRGMALAGTIVGWVGIGFCVLVAGFFIVAWLFVAATTLSYTTI